MLIDQTFSRSERVILTLDETNYTSLPNLTPYNFPHLHLIPISRQPIFTSLHHQADPDHCLGVSLIPGFTQANSNPHQLDR
ncbi:hypothetical protein HFV04_021585 [Pseudomonas sp. BIGb0427]|nr:hypothetical protein [Pseudomonas sp. BIGb0427]QPG62095.1 hypothetical protein HFV04_021585 [Pseudomonas sp. BIGb0427]